MMTPAADPGSFRDRDGRVFYHQGKILRALSERAQADWQALAATKFFGDAVADGRLVASRQIAAEPDLLAQLGSGWAAVLEHPRIPFISYPYEWCFDMLRDAALLHLDLFLEALQHDLVIKDASSYNVQWLGSNPIFIDISSFERWQEGVAWVGYRQFCQLFLYPLMLTAYKDLPFQPWLRGALDGITPEQCRRLMSLRDLLRRGVLSHVSLQSMLLRLTAETKTSVRRELKVAGMGKMVLERNARKMHSLVSGMKWTRYRSEWSSYAAQHSYDDQAEAVKRGFVEQAAATRHWRLVWDLGCNVGVYSRIAAAHADSVVAMDSDLPAVNRLYRELKAEGRRSILPLAVNLADSSPDLGWQGRERRCLEARGEVELTLCLALIHHMVIGANVPLPSFIEWLAGLGSHVVIEFITREDAMVKKLLLNREDIFSDYSLEVFEHEIGRHFTTVTKQACHDGTRILYFLAPLAPR